MTLSEFRNCLQALDRVAGNSVPMCDCEARDHGNGFFSYCYDGLVSQVLYVRADATIWEWHDTLLEDIDPSAPDAVHANIFAWMSEQERRTRLPEPA